MKRNHKSILALVLALVMLLSVLAGCNQKPEETKPNETQGNKPVDTKPVETQGVESKYPAYLNLDGYRPIVKEGEEITLKVAAVASGNAEPILQDVWFTKFIEEVLNVKLEIETIPYGERNDRISLMFNTGDLPDIMLSFGVTAAQTLDYGVDQELLLPLSDYFSEELTPNLLALYEKNPLAMESYTAPNGKVYGLPQLRGPIKGNAPTKPGGYWSFVSTKYLEAAGYESCPTDLEGFIDMLRAFKDVGDKVGVDEVIPYMGDGQTRVIFKNAMGWMTYIGDNDSNPYWDIVENKVVAPFASDRYEEYVGILHTLYTEGLIDPDCFTRDRAGIIAWQSAGKAGVCSQDAPYIYAPETYDEWLCVAPLTSKYNPDGLCLAGTSYATSSYFNVSADTEYPELCLRLLDYLYSAEGILYNSRGPAKGSEDTLGLVEGYTIDENGNFVYSEVGTKYDNNTQYTLNNIILSYQGPADDYYLKEEAYAKAGLPFPGFEKDRSQMGQNGWNYDMAELVEGKMVEALPTVYMSLEDTTRYNDLKKALNDYNNQEIAKFMTGERDMSEFGEFRKEMEALGLQEFVDLIDKYYGDIDPREIVSFD